jgi:flagellar hook-basal body complex protein FliE
MAIAPITGAAPVAAPATTKVAEAGTGFGDALRQMLATVDGTTGTANEAVARMIGGTGDVHEAMIAMQRAEMTFQLTVQVRNKLVAAYQDIMRMPI